MPFYDYRCPQCGKEFDVFIPRDYAEDIVCNECKIPAKRLMATGMKFKIDKLSFFQPYVEENITGDPILVQSKEHLRALCREHKLKIKKGPEKLL